MRLESLLGKDGPALAAGDVVMTYAELDAAARRVHARLGNHPGERIAVIAPNVPEFVIGLFATWRAGAVAVPLSARLREHELATVLADSGAVAALALSEHGGFSFADALSSLGVPTLLLDDERSAPQQLGSDPQPSADAAILYTSGSTGKPKGAYLTHDAALHWARTIAELLALGREDRTALVIPGSHAFGLASLLATLLSGGCAVLVDVARSPEPLVRAIRDHDATILHGSPAVFAGLLEAAPESLAGIRTGLVGGAASPPGLIERLDRAGPRILNVFGMTEIGAACACRANDPPEVRYETAGRAMPGYALRVVASGELQVRSEHVTRGYHGRPEATAEAFDGDWFRTRDLATIDADGWVRISGRAEELIHVGGFNVFPAEVENFLLTHPDVAQAAVLGAPHPRMGEVVKAFVVARPGRPLTPGDLLRFARGSIAGYKVPYGIEIVAELPRLPSGKVDKAALR